MRGPPSALDRLARIGFRAVEAAAWPRLLSLPDPPAILFQRGSACASGRAALAVVGARRATAYGLRVTEAWRAASARSGVAILSGLARGIDAAAHRAALAAGGRRWPCSGAAPTAPIRPSTASSRSGSARDGVVLTEYLPGTPPKPQHFPRRNRILVALADAVLVVEARRKSGTLTSAAWAADLGREVLVVPGPIDSELSEGADRSPARRRDPGRLGRPRARGARHRGGRARGCRAAPRTRAHASPSSGCSRCSTAARSTSTSSSGSRASRRRGCSRWCCRSRRAASSSARRTAARSAGSSARDQSHQSGARRTMNSAKKWSAAQISDEVDEVTSEVPEAVAHDLVEVGAPGRRRDELEHEERRERRARSSAQRLMRASLSSARFASGSVRS